MITILMKKISKTYVSFYKKLFKQIFDSQRHDIETPCQNYKAQLLCRWGFLKAIITNANILMKVLSCFQDLPNDDAHASFNQ